MPFVGDTTLVLEQVSDRTWCVVEPLTYQGKFQTFIVQENFETDLASVPRALVWLIPSYDRYTKCAVLHDWLWAKEPTVHKADANGIFRRAMREEDVSVIHRWMMWAAVGLTSTLSGLQQIRRRDLPHILTLFLVGIPSAVFVALPFVLVSVWIGLFYIVDGIGFAVDALVNTARPDGKRKQVNTPKLGWRL